MFVFVSISSCIVAMVAASCVPNPCQNGGTCSLPNMWYHTTGSALFYCRCKSGWDGQFCTIPFRYIGCYADKGDRVLRVMLPVSSSNSPLECAARCKPYAFSGTQAGNECFCGDCLNARKSPDSECNRACPGNDSYACGGPWRLSVYSNRVAGILKKGISLFGINDV